MWSRFVAPGFAQSNPTVMDELVARIRRRPTLWRGVLEQVRAMMSWYGASSLERISAPITVVHGDQDPLIPVADGRRLSQLIRGCRYEELPGVGHLVPYEAGDSLMDAISHASVRPI
jgi:pimeloyl-ACP methyl ester carboxylesterase